MSWVDELFWPACFQSIEAAIMGLGKQPLAAAVLIGRPYVWALAADGEAGVRKCIALPRQEFPDAMVAMGCAKSSDIRPTLLNR